MFKFLIQILTLEFNSAGSEHPDIISREGRPDLGIGIISHQAFRETVRLFFYVQIFDTNTHVGV